MVSNTLRLDLEELLSALKRIRREHKDEPEYRKWRKDLPKDWPV